MICVTCVDISVLYIGNTKLEDFLVHRDENIRAMNLSPRSPPGTYERRYHRRATAWNDELSIVRSVEWSHSDVYSVDTTDRA